MRQLILLAKSEDIGWHGEVSVLWIQSNFC